ncbi:integrase [Lachnospiraceae bacterium PFB1-21]
MWHEEIEGKCKFTDSYKDPMTGQRKYVSKTFDGKWTKQKENKARTVLDEKIRKKTEGNATESITLKELGKRYIAFQEQSPSIKNSTVRRNASSVKKLCKVLNGKTLVGKLNAPYILGKFYNKNANLTLASLKDLRKRLIAVLNWGYKHDMIEDISFIKKIDPVEYNPDISMKYMEEDELKAVLEQLKGQWYKTYLIAQFLVLTGLRMGEFTALNDSDVDLDSRYISVTKTTDENKKTTTTPKNDASYRKVYIQEELVRTIKQIRIEHKKEQMLLGFRSDLFYSEEGRHIQIAAFNKSFKKGTTKAIGRELTSHALRHTHTSFLAARGMTLDEIARRLGHKNSKTTREIYFHVTEKLKERERERLDAVKIL